ncbi:MAG: DUF4115 domain-containing protein [Nitrospirae bacterium]|nr:DUF4115 domain-containing protein [Nitrospirota bacterium]MDA1303242.1 DUF4115 domain-containing protein [Nitrospirota bacterium]
MDSLGTFFREAREAQDLTLEQVAASTRIQESYLQALEEERFTVLPQKVFTKGFVRTYARTLGLDEEEAFRRFSASAGSHYQQEEEAQQQVIQREEDDRKGKANRNAVIILTAVILIGLAFILPREQSAPPSTPASSPQKGKPLTSVESANQAKESEHKASGDAAVDLNGSSDTQDPISLSKTKEVPPPFLAASKPATTLPVAPKPDPKRGDVVQEVPVVTTDEPRKTMRSPFEPGRGEQDGPIMLELEALEITWVVVRSDDREPHEALLQPGERALWRAHDRFLLTLGNAGGVKVTLNGQPRGPFGKPGTVIRDLEVKP